MGQMGIVMGSEGVAILAEIHTKKGPRKVRGSHLTALDGLLKFGVVCAYSADFDFLEYKVWRAAGV